MLTDTLLVLRDAKEHLVSRLKKVDFLIPETKIPVAVVNYHNDVLPIWFKSGIRNTDLVHIDAHDDLRDKAIYELWKSRVHAGNFICPAVYYGIINSMFWINPQSDQYKIQDIGSTSDNSRPKLSTTKDSEGRIRFGVNYIRKNSEGDFFGTGVLVDEEALAKQVRPGFILDIDLDAFACRIKRYLETAFSPCQNTTKLECVDGYSDRIAYAAGILKTLPRPGLITIARSQEEFVPLDIVDDVQNELLLTLSKLYCPSSGSVQKNQ